MFSLLGIVKNLGQELKMKRTWITTRQSTGCLNPIFFVLKGTLTT